LSVEGIQPIAAEYPEVTFSGDAAGEIGVGGHDWLSTDPGQLTGLFVGERCAGRAVRPTINNSSGTRTHVLYKLAMVDRAGRVLAQ
jgi:hypothetical protein